MAKAKRPRQRVFAGMEQVKSKELEKLAEDFLDARDTWMEHHQPMIDARDRLEQKMTALKLERYEFDGKEIYFKGGKKSVAVRSMKGDESDAE